MITQTATLGLNLEKEAEAVAALEKLVAAVEANEPGVLAYICHRSEDDPSQVFFFEIYKDEEALKAHGQQPHLREMGALMQAGVLKPGVKVTKMNRVAGFHRA